MVESFDRNLNIIMDKTTLISGYIVNCVSVGKMKKSSFTLWHKELQYFCNENWIPFPETFWQSTFPDLFPLDFSLLPGTAALPSTAWCSPALPKQQTRLWHRPQATGFWWEGVCCSHCSRKFGLVKISLNSFVLFKGLIHLLYFKLSPKWVFKATFCFALCDLYCLLQLLC